MIDYILRLMTHHVVLEGKDRHTSLTQKNPKQPRTRRKWWFIKTTSVKLWKTEVKRQEGSERKTCWKVIFIKTFSVKNHRWWKLHIMTSLLSLLFKFVAKGQICRASSLPLSRSAGEKAIYNNGSVLSVLSKCVTKGQIYRASFPFFLSPHLYLLLHLFPLSALCCYLPLFISQVKKPVQSVFFKSVTKQQMQRACFLYKP